MIANERLKPCLKFLKEGVGKPPTVLHLLSRGLKSPMNKISSPDDEIWLEGVHQFRRTIQPNWGIMLIHGVAVREKTESNRF